MDGVFLCALNLFAPVPNFSSLDILGPVLEMGVSELIPGVGLETNTGYMEIGRVGLGKEPLLEGFSVFVRL